MASLYIKDDETAALATELAQRLNTSKTATVRRALRGLETELDASAPANVDKPSIMDWLREYRRAHPLPPPTGLKADKAFFDEMWGEDPD